jgi:hypothetical protein
MNKIVHNKNMNKIVHNDVAQGVALPNVTLINPFYIGPYEGYFYVCLGCHIGQFYSYSYYEQFYSYSYYGQFYSYSYYGQFYSYSYYGQFYSYSYYGQFYSYALKGKIFNLNEITKITEYTRVPVTMITYQLSGYGRVIVLT